MDLIDRQAAIDALSTPHGILYPIRTVEQLPAVQTCEDAVSRQQAIAAVSNWLYDRDDGRSVDQLLSTLPSAQPQQIVRCKDCKHRPLDGEDTQGFGIEFPDERCPCRCEDGWYNWRPDNEWFCANAERRTDE